MKIVRNHAVFVISTLFSKTRGASFASFISKACQLQ